MGERGPAGADNDRRRGKDEPAAATEKSARSAPPPARPPPSPKSNRDLEDAATPKRAERAAKSAAAETVPLEDRVPSLPPLPAAGPWRSSKEITAQLASRIVEAQRPIRVLQSIRWDPSVQERFFKARFRELPAVTAEDYAAAELGYETKAKTVEFEEIARDVERELGADDPIGAILVASAIEYRDLVRMIEARGTPMFYAYSRKLYGSPKDRFPDGEMTVRDLGHQLYEILTTIDDGALGPQHERNIAAPEAAEELNRRFAAYFADDEVRVHVDDSMLSDAAAGSDYVKVRSGARFSPRDIDILEVHEGWVHVATSLNGQAQPVAKWLAKGPPRTTAVQEGLAALLEIFTFRTYPRRARRLMDRVIAVDKAEDGASFLEVFEWFRTEGYEEEECFDNTLRVFRGGTLDGGGPFTKDACYCKGIVLNYAFIRSAIQHGRVELIPFLFVGKVAHEDIPVLASRVNEGVVRPPRYVPAMFRDLNGLAIWMAYSSFFSRLGADATSEFYGRLFARGT